MQPAERLHHPNELFAVFLEEFTAMLKREAPVARRDHGEEKLRPLAQVRRAREHIGCRNLLLAQCLLDIAADFVHAQIAHADSEVLACHFFQFMRFVEHHRAAVGQDAGIRRVFGGELDREISEK